MNVGEHLDIRIIVPRGGPPDRHRDALWAYCRRYWERELPHVRIVEGDPGPGLYNRSRAVNDGARGAWDVAIILDSDVILDVDLVETGIARAVATGRKVVPFKIRNLVSEAGTRRILGGYQGNWNAMVTGRETWNISTCVIVTRDLWDQVGGFDERFEGWGGEDNAFSDSCKVLGGGIEKLPGTAWHLWHPWSPLRDHTAPWYREAKALSDRYKATATEPAMRSLLAEPRTDDQIVVVLLTNGRRSTLAQTVRSAEQNLKGPIGRRVVAFDVRDPSQRRARLPTELFEGWDLTKIQGGTYCRAMQKATEVAIGSGQPWVFWLEDDFVFNQPVDLGAMQDLMVANPRMAQLSLLRQAWYQHEVDAGGIIAANPSLFEQRRGWVAHRAYWTQNPMLTPRRVLSSHPWPNAPHCEAGFGDLVFKDGTMLGGILGEIDDGPRVTHVGQKRAGRGY